MNRTVVDNEMFQIKFVKGKHASIALELLKRIDESDKPLDIIFLGDKEIKKAGVNLCTNNQSNLVFSIVVSYKINIKNSFNKLLPEQINIVQSTRAGFAIKASFIYLYDDSISHVYLSLPFKLI